MSIFTIEVSAAPPQAPPNNGAADLVTEGFQNAQDYAAAAFSTAASALEQLGHAGDVLTDATVAVPVLNIGDFSSDLVLPTAPTADISADFPVAPADPILTAVDDISVGQAPQFTAQPLPIEIPDAPAPFSGSLPAAPAINEVATPNAPTITLPDVPTMTGISIPAAPVLNIPDFSATLAAAPNAPANVFSFVETAYIDSLLESLKSNLEVWVNGAATGLDPVVEAAIWERGRARENVALARKQLDVYRNFASRGFSKPPGVLSVELDRAAQETQNTLSDLSRDVMIKQADLEQSNRRFAFETAARIEGELLTYNNLLAQRAFEAARYTQQILLDIFSAQVQRFAAQVQAYATEAQVYKTRIEAELAKLEVYKSELEGQKLIGEMNIQLVEIYKARITAALSQIEIFKAQVEAANLVLAGNKVRIESFAAQVGAYDSTVRAKAAEYDGYATSVRAQVAKIDVFRGQAEAYRSQVEGYTASVNAEVAKTNQQMEIRQKLPIDMFRVRTEAYRAGVDAASSSLNAQAKVFDSQVQVYSATANAEVGQLQAEVQAYRAHVDGEIGAANAQIAAAKANIDALVQKSNILVEAIKSGGQISAQIAAASLSAVNLSGQISDSVSNSASNSSSNIANNTAASQIGDVTYHNLSSE